jgi:hypothetical protein
MSTMSDEATLRAKLRKIEALFAGAGTLGEKTAAGAAAERIRAKLKGTEKAEAAIEIRLSVEDPWSRQLLIALCRRYGLRPYRYARMRRNTIVVKTPRSFLDEVLWPEFQEINAVLTDYLSEITQRVISEEIYGEVGDADEIAGGR